MGTEADRIRGFLANHSEELSALLRDAHSAYWVSATTGNAAAADRYAAAEARMKMLYSDPAAARRVRRWLADGSAPDAETRRQLFLLDLQYTGHLLAAETIEDLSRRGTELDRTFTTHRALLRGERITSNRIRDILREERDSDRRREAWEASKQIGHEVAEPLRELVRRRNAAARSLGFGDFYAMSLRLQEQDEVHLFELFEAFLARSEAPFRALRADIDATLAERYGVARDELRPWHWEDPFAQEAPSVGEIDLDSHFAGRDLEALMREFFGGIGLPVDEILARSDLWEREGKSQHAFCLDVDRCGDVRILCNLRGTEHWAMVLLHELGHAVYDAMIPRALPFILRTPAHTLSTEAIAMFMGRLTRDPRWLEDALGVSLPESARQDIAKQQRMKMLVAARWILVMVYFERELYRDPDRTDLNTLWWDLVERMQLIRPPDGRDEPDWAAKVHLSSTPVYYHNYLLGEWMASQLAVHLERTVMQGGSLVGEPDVGRYFRERVFAHGARLDWNGLLEVATGEGLNPRHFVEQFVAA